MILLTTLSALKCVSNTCSDVEHPECVTFKAIVRDFPQHAMDFESPVGASGFPQKGFMNGNMSNGNPNFLPWRLRSNVGYGQSTFTQGAALVNYGSFLFDSYYMDVPRLNIPYEIEVNLTKRQDGKYVYDSSENNYNTVIGSTNGFFPLDGTGYAEEFFGNQGHNYWYTTHVSYPFFYNGTETFEFSGDDDLYVFVNNIFADSCDLGGIHKKTACTINVGDSKFKLQKNNTYQLDVFHADRHTIESNFKLTTSILPKNIPPVGENSTYAIHKDESKDFFFKGTDANNDQLVYTIYKPFPKLGKLKAGKFVISQNTSTLNYYEVIDSLGKFEALQNGNDTIYYTIRDNCVESEMFEVRFEITTIEKLYHRPIIREPFTVTLDQYDTRSLNLTEGAYDLDNNPLFYIDDSDYDYLWEGCIQRLGLNSNTGILNIQGLAGSCNYTYLVSNKFYSPPERGRIEFIVNCKVDCNKRNIITLGDAQPTDSVFIFGSDPVTSILYSFRKCNYRRICNGSSSSYHDCSSYYCLDIIYTCISY